MNRLRKVGVIMLLVVIVSTQLIAADGDSLSPSFLEYMRGPEMYSVLQDTHKILGYTSAALGIAACVFNPVLVDDDLHKMVRIGGSYFFCCKHRCGAGQLW